MTNINFRNNCRTDKKPRHEAGVLQSADCAEKSVSRDQQESDSCADASRNPKLFEFGYRPACDNLNRHLGNFQHLVGHRILKHARDRVLAGRAHDDLIDPQTLSHTIDGLGLGTQLNMLGMRHAELVQQISGRRQSAFSFILVEVLTVTLTDKLRNVPRQRCTHMKKMHLHGRVG